MGRYDIAKNAFKTPEELFKQPKKSVIKSFGFDNESPEFEGTGYLKRAKSYYCPVGTARRVGIVFKDPKHLFIAGHTHWINKQYVLCKKGLCCASSSNRQMRFACVIAVYDGVEYSVTPWLFGKNVYQKLKDLNNNSSIHSNDFILKRVQNGVPTWAGRYSPWEVSALGLSLWQLESIKEDVLRLAEPHFLNLKSCLGLDLSDSEIQNLIQNSPVDRPTRPVYRPGGTPYPPTPLTSRIRQYVGPPPVLQDTGTLFFEDGVTDITPPQTENSRRRRGQPQQLSPEAERSLQPLDDLLAFPEWDSSDGS